MSSTKRTDRAIVPPDDHVLITRIWSVHLEADSLGESEMDYVPIGHAIDRPGIPYRYPIALVATDVLDAVL